eukprot:7128851-Pyramimonas_sp.AAC.1
MQVRRRRGVSLWGHETCEVCVCVCVPKSARSRHADPAAGAFGGAPHGATKRVRGVPARVQGPCRWGLRWSSPVGHDMFEGCVPVRHADVAAGAFGEAPFGAAERVSGVPNRVR